jgi:pyruvate/2-oxoglutarate dehydrogenase complex dihydrolipoamide acyltransferase (E2) component
MIEVPIPKMGMSTVDVDMNRVFITVGQVIHMGDPLVEIEGDKSAFVVEAECNGTIVAISVEEGKVYDVGHIICTVDETRGQ